MSDKIFIDANIFLYAFSTLDPAKQLRAKDIVLSPHCVISVQVVNEVSSNLLKKLKLTEEQVNGFVADCYERYALVNFSKSLFVIAANIRQSHSDVLYSEDMAHNQLMGGRVRIVNPFL
jgi:predicted nucleic acid-binding protein